MIGERLAEVRKDHGDTQAALAKRLRVTLSAVRSWEQEKSSPSHEMLVAICRLYHISSDYLLGLSNVDPAYAQRKRISAFSQKELDMLRDYEKYLLWRQREAYGGKEKRVNDHFRSFTLFCFLRLANDTLPAGPAAKKRTPRRPARQPPALPVRHRAQMAPVHSQGLMDAPRLPAAAQGRRCGKRPQKSGSPAAVYLPGGNCRGSAPNR